jgi:prepilin-type N-terminal cleavage/methylation domain-containing protein
VKINCSSDAAAGGRKIRNSQFAIRNFLAFTLIEMLVVIAILGLLAGLAVPALKNLGKSNVNVSAGRQLLDDFGRARQLAMANRTTVYMVFVPTNFWCTAYNPGSFNSPWFNSLTPAAQTAATNLCDKQLTGYTFIGSGTVGDQPGRHTWHYLASWQNLPEGVFIAQQKFVKQPNQFYTIADAVSGAAYNIYGFNVTNNIPFPTETNTAATTSFNLPYLPYIAFNSSGQLVSGQDEYIPVARGNVSPALNPATKTFVLTGSPSVTEIPAGNSTDISYNIVHIDALTGRATMEFHKMLP